MSIAVAVAVKSVQDELEKQKAEIELLKKRLDALLDDRDRKSKRGRSAKVVS